MKNSIFKTVFFFMFLLGIGACNSEESLPPVNPFIGEWQAADDQFLILTVDGEEKTLAEFGVQILKTNPISAETTAADYLRHTIMGPIDIYEPEILIAPQELFSATVAGERVAGIWKLQNAGSVLHFNSLDLRENGYFYNVKRLSGNELDLEWSWEMSYIGENSGVYDVHLVIKLKK
ncbi:hypothetical protein [Shivajiella indica]|uniref:Uncharacterized protein n=1 Tax=Shivajiella indica TaxID=872115 RepID=A0ABW5B7B6_9BACT